MGKAELVDKILSDGRARAASIKSDSEQRRAKVTAQADAEVKRLEAEAGEKLARETGVILERARSTARLHKRNALLAAKWGVLDRVAEEATKKLLADARYPELLKGIVARHAQAGSEVRMSAADAKRGVALPTGVKQGEPAQMDGGVIVRTGREELNFSLADSVAAVRETLVAELSRKLFAG